MICTNPNFVFTYPYSCKSAPLSDPNIFIILKKKFLLVRKCMLFHHPYLQFAGEEGLLSSPACAVPELAKPPTPPSSDPTLQPLPCPRWIGLSAQNCSQHARYTFSRGRRRAGMALPFDSCRYFASPFSVFIVNLHLQSLGGSAVSSHYGGIRPSSATRTATSTSAATQKTASTGAAS